MTDDPNNSLAPKNSSETEPKPPLPEQKLSDKPGSEADMELQPRFEAPDYKGSAKLKGKTALITGGDSGIGRAVAILFAREGANVAIVYLNEHEDAEKTAQLVEGEGSSCLLISGDVTLQNFCDEAVNQTISAFGELNILINNAAVQTHVDSLDELGNDQWDHTFRSNIYSYFYMTKAAVPHLTSGSCIINSGSVTGYRGSKHLLDYASTKGGIHAFTKSLANMLLDKGIRVNAVAPGPVWTPLIPSDISGKELSGFGSSTVFGRPAQPEEIAPSYVFLASPCCASYITGMILPITGSIE